MVTAEPPVGSFDRLARAALAAASWPADQAVKERSLAAILGKLDRGDYLGSRQPPSPSSRMYFPPAPNFKPLTC